MMILSPSILAADFLNLGRDIKDVEEAGAQFIHFDVMDGVFVPSISFGMPVLSAIRQASGCFLDVHLMIVEPEKYVDEFAACGADGITIHLEATEHVADVLKHMGELGIRRGLAISPDTEVSAIIPYLPMLDMILIMTVHPGRGGQKFIDSCADKVRTIRRIITEKDLHIDIEVDGGIKQNNVQMIMEAGANVIVAGSAVFDKEYTRENTMAFLELFHKWEMQQTR